MCFERSEICGRVLEEKDDSITLLTTKKEEEKWVTVQDRSSEEKACMQQAGARFHRRHQIVCVTNKVPEQRQQHDVTKQINIIGAKLQILLSES